MGDRRDDIPLTLILINDDFLAFLGDRGFLDIYLVLGLKFLQLNLISQLLKRFLNLWKCAYRIRLIAPFT
jgi:hypothetical protein